MKRKYYVGVDLHKSVIQVFVLDSRGRAARRGEFTIRGDTVESAAPFWRRMSSLGSVIVAVEALGLNRWFVNECKRRKIDVIVVDPTKLRLKESGAKTDRRDARELARRLFLGDLEQHAKTYFATEREFGVRKILRARHKLIGIRQQIVNQIRGILNAYRIPSPGSVLYTRRALEKLHEINLPSWELQLTLRVFRSQLEQIQEGLATLDAEVARHGREEDVQRLAEAVPGIAAQTATTILAELGDVRRFRGPRQVAAYAGLVPRVANSADRQNHGRLTKKGNRELRWILGQWAVRLLARDSLVKEWAEPMLRRMHKNKVRVALARRLLVGVYHMLRTGELFDLRRCLAT